MKNFLPKLRPKILTLSGIILSLLCSIWGAHGAISSTSIAFATEAPPSSTSSTKPDTTSPDPASIKSPPTWPIDTDKFPAVALKSINPGYNSNTGELIELVRLSDNPVTLDGVTIRYFNKSGTQSDLYIFPEGSSMIDETIVLRYSGSPDVKEAEGEPEMDAMYKKSLAFEAGPLQLVYHEEVFDAVCWTGKDCYKAFNSKSPTSLVRDIETGEFQHISTDEYEASFNSGLKIEVAPEAVVEPQCKGLQFSEVFTYYETDVSEQFIELYNDTDTPMTLDGCNIAYKNKTINLTGSVEASSLAVVRPDFALTKNPSSTNTLEIIDVNGDKVDKLVIEHGQKKAASLAQFGYSESGEETWQQTYQQTPGERNLYQEYRSCEAGKVINETTGNCVKASSLATTTTECKEGYYRNPATGRCKKIATSTTSECKEGYERNPETGRCRKIKTNTGANYAMETREYEQKSVFIALTAVAIIIMVGVGYTIFQFRREIYELFQKIFKKSHPSATSSPNSGKSPHAQKSKKSLKLRKQG